VAYFLLGHPVYQNWGLMQERVQTSNQTSK